MNLQLSDFIFIFDHTTHPGNLGSISRVCKNMGMENIRLVSPLCDKNDEQAIANAAGATDTLKNMEVFPNMEQALADISLIFATSARKRAISPKITTPALIVKQANTMLANSNNKKVAILFGTEHSGLSNELLMQANFHIIIDANPKYSSFNLAMASLIIAYEIRSQLKGSKDLSNISLSYDQKQTIDNNKELASYKEINNYLKRLEEHLLEIDFIKNDLIALKLNKMIKQIALEQNEIQLLQGILSANIKLREENKKLKSLLENSKDQTN